MHQKTDNFTDYLCICSLINLLERKIFYDHSKIKF